VRAYKTVNDQMIEPISFIVPRRAEVFQDDIYPPTVGLKPAMSAGDWFGGEEGLPPKISLESVYEGNAPQEVPSDDKPSAPLHSTQSTAPSSPKLAASAPASTKMEPEQPKPAPVPAAIKSPSPSMSDNKASMASMASKFADKDEVSSSDEEPFEEIQKPVSRGPANSAAASRLTSAAKPESVKEASPPPVSRKASPPPAEKEEPTPPVAEIAATTTAAPRTAAEGLKATLQEIKAMLESQGRQIVEQAEQIAVLSREVESLKSS